MAGAGATGGVSAATTTPPIRDLGVLFPIADAAGALPPQTPPWCIVHGDGQMGRCLPWAGLISLPVLPSGGQYWLFREANLEPGFPQPLSSYGLGLPHDRVDAAVWWEPTGHTFFFRGDRWVMGGTAASSSSGGLPFMAGLFLCRYWRFNEDGSSVGHGYPRKVSVWAGVPAAPRGAFLSPDAGKYNKKAREMAGGGK